MKNKWLVTILIFLISWISFADDEKKESARDQLTCDVLVKGNDFIYGMNIYPSKVNKVLFHWEVIIQNFKTKKILCVLRSSTMRGQENIFERTISPDGSKIKITTSIDIQQDRIKYHIQRIDKKKLVYSYKGEKEIFIKAH
jgi:hypothetical protein